jgi:hypothetical protein
MGQQAQRHNKEQQVLVQLQEQIEYMEQLGRL